MTGNNVASNTIRLKDTAPSMRASKRPEWNALSKIALGQAVADFDIAQSSAWDELQDLSSNTEIDGVFPFPESAMFQDGHFIVPATIGVTLNYGDKSESIRMGDSFPADIVFDVIATDAEPKINILSINVDTRSFFE